MVPVAARIEKIDSMSAHADSQEILRWLGTFQQAARTDLSRARRAGGAGCAESDDREDELGWTVHIPEHGEKVEVPL